MKKVFIVYGGAQTRGGIYTYLLKLFEKSQESEDVKLTLASIGNWPLTQELWAQNYEVVTISKNPFGFLGGLKKVKNYDVIVTMGLVSNVFGRFWGILGRKKVLTVIHSDWRTDYLSSPVKKVFFWLSDRVLRFSTTKYICVSEYLKKLLIAEGVKSEKIAVIYNGVSVPNNSSIKKRTKFHKPVRIVSVGRLHPVKNFPNLIKACAELSDSSWELTIYGEGAKREKLQKLIKSLGFESKVKLPGQTNKKWEDLFEADIFAQTSLSEGFGLSVVEAMLVGLPVLVTPQGALPELIKNNSTGYIATDVTDKAITQILEKIIKNPTQAIKIGFQARQFALLKFDENNWAKSTLSEFIK